MTLIEAAAKLGITPDTLRQQIGAGKLRATKRGRDWWVTDFEVGRYGANIARHGIRVPLVDRSCGTCGATFRAAAEASLCRECGAVL